MPHPDSPRNSLLRYLILFVTSRCNSRCATCFSWKAREEAEADLTLDEIERIAAPLGPLEALLLSGGEPTLREDLPELVGAFFRHNQVKNVGLPTNGLLPERARDLAQRILELCPGMRLDVNVSLDDIGKRHDTIRGVEGNFERALETIRLVGALRERYDCLRLNVSTVIFSANWRHIPEFLDYVREQLDVDSHYVELIRGRPRNGELELPPAREVFRLNRLILKNHLRYHARRGNRRWPHEMPYLRELARWQEMVLRGEQWPALCAAGRQVAVIETDGRVRACELRGIIGDLRASVYDLRRVLESPEAQGERRAIEETRCSCTHCVFLYETFFVNSVPSERRRRWLERWYNFRMGLEKVL